MQNIELANGVLIINSNPENGQVEVQLEGTEERLIIETSGEFFEEKELVIGEFKGINMPFRIFSFIDKDGYKRDILIMISDAQKLSCIGNKNDLGKIKFLCSSNYIQHDEFEKIGRNAEFVFSSEVEDTYLNMKTVRLFLLNSNGRAYEKTPEKYTDVEFNPECSVIMAKKGEYCDWFSRDCVLQIKDAGHYSMDVVLSSCEYDNKKPYMIYNVDTKDGEELAFVIDAWKGEILYFVVPEVTQMDELLENLYSVYGVTPEQVRDRKRNKVRYVSFGNNE